MRNVLRTAFAITIVLLTVDAVFAQTQCSYSIFPGGSSYTGSGGSGSVTLTAPAGCPWQATSNVAWIAVTNGSSGTGNGTVQYSVLPNGGRARTGSITIADQTFLVTQTAGGTGCSFMITPTAASYTAGGGTGTVTVTGQPGCSWSASSGANWIMITGGGSGTGDGVLSYVVAANNGNARSGTLTIAGLTLTVSQGASTGNCSYSLGPSSASLPASGGTSSTSVIATAGCGWTSQTGTTWITITSGFSGTGSGVVTFVAQPNNTGAERAGSLLIAGGIFQVQQAGCPQSAPAALSPAEGARSPIMVPFSWTAVAGAVRYTVTVIDTAGNLVQTVTTSAAETSMQLLPGTYDWTIEAERNDCPTVKSATFRFTVAPSRRRAVNR